jgi:hypothetical protein
MRDRSASAKLFGPDEKTHLTTFRSRRTCKTGRTPPLLRVALFPSGLALTNTRRYLGIPAPCGSLYTVQDYSTTSPKMPPHKKRNSAAIRLSKTRGLRGLIRPGEMAQVRSGQVRFITRPKSRTMIEQFHCFDDVTVSGSPIIRVLSVSGLGSEKNPVSDPKIAF